MDNWKTRIYIIAGVIGAAAGILAGYMIVRQSEELNQPPRLSAGDGVKLGLGVIGLLRLVSEFSAEQD